MAACLVLPPAASATSASVANGVLTVTGTEATDNITVTLPPPPAPPPPAPPPLPPVTAQYEVSDPAGVTAGSGCTEVPPTAPATVSTVARCTRGDPAPAFGLFRIVVNGGAGDDALYSSQPDMLAHDPVALNGGPDNDALFGSDNDDTISGDAGNDLLDGGLGSDLLTGGTAVGLPRDDGGFPPAPGAGNPGTDTVYGGSGSDLIADGDEEGSLGADILDGGPCPAGAPTPVTGVLCPVANLEGVEDSDFLLWGHRISAIKVDFLLTGGQGAAGENETIRNIEGVAGGSGNDTLLGSNTDQIGGVKDDSLRGNGGDDHLDGRIGDDEMLGGDGRDRLIGGQGSDVLNPGGRAGAVPGVLVADGSDSMDGGSDGTTDLGMYAGDQVSYEGRSDPLTIDLRSPYTLGAPGENDQVAGIEDVMGGHGGDRITGDANKNLIAGDPVPPLAPLPGEPPPPPRPPTEFGDDVINTRDDVSDTVDCTGGAGDLHIADRLDASILCETVDRPPPPPPPPPPPGSTCDPARDRFCERRPDGTYGAPGSVEISGRRVAGRRRVARDGSFTLHRHFVHCPRGGGGCVVRTTVTARVFARSARKASASARRKKTIRVGSTSYVVSDVVASSPAAESIARVRGKLTKTGLRLLRRRKALAASVIVTVVRDARTTRRAIAVTLLPARRR